MSTEFARSSLSCSSQGATEARWQASIQKRALSATRSRSRGRETLHPVQPWAPCLASGVPPNGAVVCPCRRVPGSLWSETHPRAAANAHEIDDVAGITVRGQNPQIAVSGNDALLRFAHVKVLMITFHRSGELLAPPKRATACAITKHLAP